MKKWNPINIFEKGAEVPNFMWPTIEKAQEKGYKYVMVVSDTFNDYQNCGFTGKGLPPADYPIYCRDDKELDEAWAKYEDVNFQAIQEVYQVLREPDTPVCLVCGRTAYCVHPASGTRERKHG